MKNLFTKALLAGVASAAFATGASANTLVNNFDFDYNGAAPGGLIKDVTSFDWIVDNAYSDNGQNAVINFLGNGSVAGPNTLFNTYYHARLGTLLNNNGDDVTPAGLNNNFEITVVTGFQEDVTFVAPTPLGTPGNFAQFKATGAAQSGAPGLVGQGVSPSYVPNFFEIYYDDLTDLSGMQANTLSGNGFADGTLILSGVVLPDLVASTNFSVTGPIDPDGPGPLLPTFPNLDGFVGDNYPTLDSIVGFGGTSITVGVTGQDFSFFLQKLIISSLFNTTNKLNFTETNPSARFNLAPNGAGGSTLAGAGLGVPDLGAINGLPTGPIPAPSIQFQADGNESFLAEENRLVPEPMTAGLSMLALAGLGLGALRRRRNG